MSTYFKSSREVSAESFFVISFEKEKLGCGSCASSRFLSHHLAFQLKTHRFGKFPLCWFINMPRRNLGEDSGAPAPKRLRLSERKADSALSGLRDQAEKKQWDDDVKVVLESIQRDRDLCLSVVGNCVVEVAG